MGGTRLSHNKRIEFLIITTPSLLAFEVVKKQVELLHELKMPIVGIVENMKMNISDNIKCESTKLGLKYLGSIAFDVEVEASIGNPTKLLGTAIGKSIDKIKKIAFGTKGSSRSSITSVHSSTAKAIAWMLLAKHSTTPWSLEGLRWRKTSF
jgi:hypothetical protein